MNARILVAVMLFAHSLFAVAEESPKPDLGILNINVPPIAGDRSVKYDFPIDYVRATRRSPDGRSRRTELRHPRKMETGADLVILYPDGKERVLVEVDEKDRLRTHSRRLMLIGASIPSSTMRSDTRVLTSTKFSCDWQDRAANRADFHCQY